MGQNIDNLEKMPKSSPKGNREKPLDKIECSKYRARNLVFTSFDEKPIEPRKEGISDNQVKYLIQGKEKCPTSGTLHWQCYVYFYDKVSIKTAKKRLGIIKGWFQYAYGNHQQNIDYCSKEGDYSEWGTAPQQGKRKDLEELRDEILKGERTVDEICEEMPHMVHLYGRTLDRLEDIKLNKNKRTKMTKGYWLFGDTGTGKTHYFNNKILKDKNEEHYTWCLNEEFQCEYKQQRCVLLDDFRGELTIGQLCKLVDKWNTCKVKRKNKRAINFTSEIVVITCPMRPNELFIKANVNDKLAQLYRRFEMIEFKERYKK